MKVSGPSPRALWALLWRSVVLLPFASVLLVLLCVAWIGLVALPIAAGFCVWSSDWLWAVVCVALWLPTFVFVRWLWKRERSDSFKHDGDLV